jgi:hypothetical protein
MLPEHRGTNTVVIRIVKIISPVQYKISNYDGSIPLPTEGALVMRKTSAGLVRTFSIDTAEVQYNALHGLFRNEETMSAIPESFKL